MGKYITQLTRNAFEAIPDMPEIANITRIKRKGPLCNNRLLYVELKDEDGTLYYAQVSWDFFHEANVDYVTFNIAIGKQRWCMRFYHYDDDMHIVPVDPHQEPWALWYEGLPVDLRSDAETPTCTCCKVRSNTVQQAYWGGHAVPRTALCTTCREHIYYSETSPFLGKHERNSPCP